MNTPEIALSEKSTIKKPRLLVGLVAAAALSACTTPQRTPQELDQFGNNIPLESETDTEYIERQNNNQVIPDNSATSIFELKSAAHNLAKMEEKNCIDDSKQENFERAQGAYENCRENIVKNPSITSEEAANIRHQVCIITANKGLEQSNQASLKSCAIQSCEIEATMLGQSTGGGLFSKGLCEDGIL